VAAFCGIGNPAGFWHTLGALRCQVAAWREFPDHHAFSRDDVEALAEWARAAGVSQILCTRKDMVKLRVGSLGGVPLRAVSVELRFLRGEESMAAAIDPLAERALQSNGEMFRLPEDR
jgi:tetraacyldisaccharide 4'-kinase